VNATILIAGAHKSSGLLINTGAMLANISALGYHSGRGMHRSQYIIYRTELTAYQAGDKGTLC
jgi:hypothetical protein